MPALTKPFRLAGSYYTICRTDSSNYDYLLSSTSIRSIRRGGVGSEPPYQSSSAYIYYNYIFALSKADSTTIISRCSLPLRTLFSSSRTTITPGQRHPSGVVPLASDSGHQPMMASLMSFSVASTVEAQGPAVCAAPAGYPCSARRSIHRLEAQCITAP